MKELEPGLLNPILFYPLPLPFSLLFTLLLPNNQSIFILDQNIYLTYSQYLYKKLINTAMHEIFYSSLEIKKPQTIRGRKPRKNLSKLMIERSVPAHGFYFQWGVVCPSKKMSRAPQENYMKNFLKNWGFWKSTECRYNFTGQYGLSRWCFSLTVLHRSYKHWVSS